MWATTIHSLFLTVFLQRSNYGRLVLLLRPFYLYIIQTKHITYEGEMFKESIKTLDRICVN